MKKEENKLIEACKTGNLDKIKHLIKQGTDIHAEHDMALQLASLVGELDIVKFLIKNGASISVRKNLPLRWAELNGHKDIVEYLTEQIKGK